MTAKSKLSPQGLKQLQVLETNIGYQFNDKAIAVLALTHSSYGDGRRKISNNEQLEFLGDRVLGLLTAEKLYKLNLGDEGGMARRLNALVRKETCADVARTIKLGDALLISPSEIRQGGRNKTSILGDACEAILAAIYLDGSYTAAQDFYNKFWSDQISKITKISAKDPKTSLQEDALASGFGLPVYQVVTQSGPDHKPSFVIEVEVSGLGMAVGEGSSKKDAERAAAIILLGKLRSNTL